MGSVGIQEGWDTDSPAVVLGWGWAADVGIDLNALVVVTVFALGIHLMEFAENKDRTSTHNRHRELSRSNARF